MNQFILVGTLLSKRLNYAIIYTEEAHIEVYIPDELMPIINPANPNSIVAVKGKIKEYHSLHAEEIIILED